jgi:fibronectin type III domain protein
MVTSNIVTGKSLSVLLVAGLAILSVHCGGDGGSGVTAPTDPSIGLSETNKSFSATAGSGDPAAQTVAISNAGDGTLSGLAASVAYGAGQPTGWLNATLSAATAPSTLTLTPTTGSLTEGTYAASVAVTSAAASNSPQSVSVTFTVAAGGGSPSISLSSTDPKIFGAPQGGANPAAQTVSVTNGGGGTLSGLALSIAYGDGQPTGWLNASLSQTTAPSTLTVTATTGSLTAGTYTASVAVTSAAASNSPQFLFLTFTVTSPPPEAPSGLTATVVSSSQIDLTWTDNASNEDGFDLEQCTGAGCTSFVEIALGPNVTSYQSTGLSAETSYSYRVRARNSAGNSAYSNTVSATTPPTMPPPTDLTATAVSSSRIDLTWTDNSSDEDGFQIERCTGAGCTDFEHIATVPRDFPRYPDSGLSAGTSYSYRVRASNDDGTSPYSNIASATTPP